MTDTQELLRKFVANGSEAAFRELVSRYFDLVYSTAVRLADGNTHTAEDVAQMVFCDLARMAGKLAEGTMLGGWLHRHTCFVAKTVMRGERRRQKRERQAVEMNALNNQGVSMLAQLAPILDESINELGGDDRDVILLRFFEHRNLRSVGEALGMSENAAQKRVTRAVHELRMLLHRRGVTISAAALATGLSAGAVTAAPAGLAVGVAGAVLADVGAGGGMGFTAANLATTAKLKAGIATALVVVVVVSIIRLEQQNGEQVRTNSPVPKRQPIQPQKRASAPGEPVARRSEVSAIAMPLPEPSPAEAVAQPLLPGSATQFSRPSRPTFSPPPSRGPLLPAAVRFFARSGSKVRIEGKSNIGDWQVESPLIGGALEIGPGFPLEPGVSIVPGPVRAQGEAFIAVRSLKSVEKDGKPYSDKMDEVMYETLRAELCPKIQYRLLELTYKGTKTNQDDRVEYEFQSSGELSLAGVTKEILMPVFVLPIGDNRLRISGEKTISMTSFDIVPPAPKIPVGMIKSEDEVTVSFSWNLKTRPSPAASVASQTSSTAEAIESDETRAAQDGMFTGE